MELEEDEEYPTEEDDDEEELMLVEWLEELPREELEVYPNGELEEELELEDE